MFSSINVLIAEGDHEKRAEVRNLVQAQTFSVRTVGDGYVGLTQIDKADILVLDMDLPNGSSQLLLDKWVDENRGPVVVLVDLDPLMVGSTEDAYACVLELILGGAWNVLPEPLQAQTLHRVLQNYATVIIGKRALDQVPKLRRALFGLALVVAAMVGTRIVPPLLDLLALLL